MRSYKVQFLKNKEERDVKGKLKKTGEVEFLGQIEVDDTGVGKDLTLAAKAFRRASEKMSMADKLVINEV